MINTSKENFRNLTSWERKQNKRDKVSKKSEALKKTLEKGKGGMLGKLKQMQSEPASKEWFEKHGLPKSIKHHPLKK